MDFKFVVCSPGGLRTSLHRRIQEAGLHDITAYVTHLYLVTENRQQERAIPEWPFWHQFGIFNSNI